MSVEFARRHIGPSAEEQRRMLDTIGYGSVDELMDAAIPGVDPRQRAAATCRRRRPRPRCSPSCARSPGGTGRWSP